MTRRKVTVTAWQRGRHTGVVRGPVRVVHPAIRHLGLPWQWDAQARAYLVNVKRLDDLLAALELDGHRVDYRAALW